MNNSTSKVCPKCGQEKVVSADKSISEFYPTKNGFRSYCKQCSAKLRKNDAGYTKSYNERYYKGHKKKLAKRFHGYYQVNRGKLRSYGKSYYAGRREGQLEKDILIRVRSRAKKLGVPFNLTLEDIVIPITCPILGIPIGVQQLGRKGPSPNSPSVDRLKPNGGYIRGNVRIISNRANTLKLNATIEELEMVLADLRSRPIEGSD